MVLRFLFGLTTSLLSGSAVAILLIATVGQFFSDPTDPQPKPPLVKPYQAAQSTNGEPPARSTTAEIGPATRTGGLPETGLEQASDPPAQQPTGEPQQTVLTQEPSPSTEQGFSTPADADVPAESAQQPASSKPAPVPPTQPLDIAGAGQSIGQVSVQERKPELGPISEQNAHTGDPTFVKPPEAGDAHAGAATGGRSTRAQPVARVHHASHAHRGRSTFQAISAAAQHQAQK
jgi:hypothetical protein